MPIGIDVIRALLGSSSQEERPKAIFVERLGGLGDVIMALGAVHGLRAKYPEARIYLHTEPRYAELAERCPFLDGVFTSASLLRGSMHEHLGKKFDVKRFELGIYSFGINHDHQINAFLLAMDIYASSKHKEARVELRSDEEQKAHEKIQSLLGDRSGKRIVFHPARGDKNRTWPAHHWDRLTSLALEAGCQPIVVGDDSSVPFKGVMKIPARKGLLNLTNQLSLLELIQLLRECDVFVSPDSGPVQVAGLTDIGIVGIYSTVPPHCRLPFRHGMEAWRARGMVSDCPHQGCYQLFLKDDAHFETLQAAIREDLLHPGCQATNTLMGDYCVRKDRIYACLEDITPQKVWGACRELLETDHLHLADQLREAREALAAGESDRALGLLEMAERQHPTAEVKVEKATALCLEERWQEAVDLLEGVLSGAPGTESLNLLGLICHLHGDAEKGSRFFESSLRWNEAYLPVLMNLAYIKAQTALAAGICLEGLTALDAYFELLPRLEPSQRHHVFPPDQAHTLKGWLMLQIGQSSEARGAFEAALDLNPRGAEALAGLAEFCYRTGDNASAIHCYQRMIEVQPDSPLAVERLAGLGISPCEVPPPVRDE